MENLPDAGIFGMFAEKSPTLSVMSFPLIIFAVTAGKVAGWILAALAVLIFFSLTILIHEGGHFMAARMLGLRAETFALGFGKAIWKRKIGETEYRVNIFPFGGYVALPQLDPAGMQALQGSGSTLPQAAWWKRIIVAVAGPAGNVLFAVILSFVVWALPPIVPETLEFDGAVVGIVEKGSEAEKAGLRPGDSIISVGGTQVSSWSDYRVEAHLLAESEVLPLSVSNILTGGAVRNLNARLSKDEFGYNVVSGAVEAVACAVTEVIPGSPADRAGLARGDIMHSVNGTRVISSQSFVSAISESKGAPVALKYRRGDTDMQTSIQPEILTSEDAPTNRLAIGVVIAPVSVSPPQWAQFRRPADQLRGDAASIFRVLKPLVGAGRKGEARRVGGSLGGPIVILSSMWMTMLSGFAGALAFIRFLNVNLAILNLLPIPVLDGGHVVFALWRGIFRREMPQRITSALVNGFAVLIIGLFIYLAFHDVWLLATRFGH